MGRRITLYDAALAEAFEAGGDPARLSAIAAFGKAEKIFGRIHIIRSLGAPNFGLTGAVVLLALIVGWAFSGFTQDFWSLQPVAVALGVAGVLFGLAFACLAVWDIMIGLEKGGYVPKTLKAPELAPFHSVRKRCADRTASAFDDGGKPYDSPMFTSHWSLILFSQFPNRRKYRLPHSSGIISAQPLIDLPTSKELAEFKTADDTEQTVQPANTVLNFFRTSSTIIVRYIFHMAPQPKRKPRKAAKPHWYASVSEEVHKSRSVKIANHWAGNQVEQVQLALNTAFELTRDGGQPCINVVTLVDKIAKTLTAKKLPVGLGNTESSVWISMMFSDRKSPYEWVRRYLTEPDFEPSPRLPLSD